VSRAAAVDRTNPPPPAPPYNSGGRDYLQRAHMLWSSLLTRIVSFTTISSTHPPPPSPSFPVRGGRHAVRDVAPAGRYRRRGPRLVKRAVVAPRRAIDRTTMAIRSRPRAASTTCARGAKAPRRNGRRRRRRRRRRDDDRDHRDRRSRDAMTTTTTTTGRGGGWRNLGKPVQLAARYHAEGADEIAFLNITSSSAPGPRGVVQVHLRAAHGRGGGYAVTPTRIAGSSHAELHRHGRSVRGE
jgi:hypothetical protein